MFATQAAKVTFSCGHVMHPTSGDPLHAACPSCYPPAGAEPVILTRERPRYDTHEAEWTRTRKMALVGAFVALFVAGLLLADPSFLDHPNLHRDHAAAAQESPPATPKEGAERWVLATWLPTVLTAPYGASAHCTPGSGQQWSCAVTQTATDHPLPAQLQRHWTVRAAGAWPIYNVLSVVTDPVR